MSIKTAEVTAVTLLSRRRIATTIGKSTKDVAKDAATAIVFFSCRGFGFLLPLLLRLADMTIAVPVAVAAAVAIALAIAIGIGRCGFLVTF
jgi:hypothetical protein